MAAVLAVVLDHEMMNAMASGLEEEESRSRTRSTIQVLVSSLLSYYILCRGVSSSRPAEPLNPNSRIQASEYYPTFGCLRELTKRRRFVPNLSPSFQLGIADV
jgi:hypothetical protein